MPCDTIAREERERRERERQLQELEKQLREKSARIVRVGDRVSIEGWRERGGWCDSCAVGKLRLSRDSYIRNLAATAAPAGRKLTFGHGH